MKRIKLKVILTSLLVVAGSCNDPKTVLTNIVNKDGSILRKLEIRNSENNFKVSNVPIPYDSTWTIRDSIEIGQNHDTTWVRRAQKLFKGAEEISKEYRVDSSYNRNVPRRVEFHKKFRWFNTEFTYEEIIDKKLLLHGYPVTDFLNSEEVKWFYSPDNLNDEKKNGTDSLKYRAFDDTIKKKVEKWTVKCLVSELMYEFAGMTSGIDKPGLTIDSLKKHEDGICKIIESNSDKFDSIWTDAIIGKEMMGENSAVLLKSKVDSALKTVENRYFVDFRNYTLRTLMPGELISTTGIIDSSGYVFWPVKSDYILTNSYKMRAESKVPNKWAWIVSGLFLLFVVAGMIFKKTWKG